MLEYGYEPNDINSDMFLSEIPMKLMKENIKVQFTNPLEYRAKDYITTFINQYKTSKENLDLFEDEDKDNLQMLRDDFYAFMQEMFQTYFNVGIVDFDDMSEQDQDDYIHYIYRYFIMNIKRNFLLLVLNHIEKMRDTFEFDEEKKKDVTSLAFKKEVSDTSDIYILGNLTAIITEIIFTNSIDLDVQEFLTDCDEIDPCLETEFMKKHYEDYEITGNFVEKYTQMVTDDFISELESKIRNKILKKYKAIDN